MGDVSRPTLQKSRLSRGNYIHLVKLYRNELTDPTVSAPTHG